MLGRKPLRAAARDLRCRCAPLTALSPVLRGSRRDEGRPDIKRHACGASNKGQARGIVSAF
jgi:hypothetical protein